MMQLNFIKKDKFPCKNSLLGYGEDRTSILGSFSKVTFRTSLVHPRDYPGTVGCLNSGGDLPCSTARWFWFCGSSWSMVEHKRSL